MRTRSGNTGFGFFICCKLIFGFDVLLFNLSIYTGRNESENYERISDYSCTVSPTSTPDTFQWLKPEPSTGA
ncbi:hypothetical protein V5739_03960 [Salinimicrobium sp. TIG7-5_MAKvit]|uniref:hypothetical protein n=1 Tax=Salinimicrobium sp. TIG7-5_MAKvit TaxID=3121289 RepID=UPI003C6DFCE3